MCSTERRSTGLALSRERKTRQTCLATTRAMDHVRQWLCSVPVNVRSPIFLPFSLPPPLSLYNIADMCSRAHGDHPTYPDPKSVRHPRQCWIRLCACHLLHLLYPHPRRDGNQETRRRPSQGRGRARSNPDFALCGAGSDVLSSTSKIAVNPSLLRVTLPSIYLYYDTVVLLMISDIHML